MIKKIVAVCLVIACLSGIGYWYMYTKGSRVEVSDAMYAIPSNAAFIIESRNVQNLWSKLSESNIIWQELQVLAPINKASKVLMTVDSLVNENRDIRSYLKGSPVFISAHMSGANTFDFLYSYSLPSIMKQSSFEEFFADVSGGKPPGVRRYDGVDIRTLYSVNLNDSINYSFFKGVLLMSATPSLVESAIRQMKSSTSLFGKEYVREVHATSGKNVDANFYVNYKHIGELFNQVASPSLRRQLAMLPAFSSFSGWDVSIKSNAFMLSGFTQAKDVNARFLSLFDKQKEQELTLTKVLPHSTSQFMFWGISDMKKFYHDFKYYKNDNNKALQYTRELEEYNSKYHIDIEGELTRWIHNEVAVVLTQSFEQEESGDNVFAVFKSNVISNAEAGLKELVRVVDAKDGNKTVSVMHHDREISQLQLKGVWEKLFGHSFSTVTENYFCAVDDYIVMGNSVEALKTLLDKYQKGLTLDNDEYYQTYADNMANESNVYVYSSFVRSIGIYQQALKGKYSKELESYVDLLRKFDAFGVQFTSTDGLFYSNAYVNYNPVKKEESVTLWEKKLDTTITNKPYFVKNHYTGYQEVFVQDDKGQVYLISPTGRILWKRNLGEQIMSEVKQIDVYKNDKLQLVFNTASKIYLIDRNGEDVEGFPVDLPAKATNSMSVLDYDNNRQYRLFVATDSNTINCYSSNGKIVEGFDLKEPIGKVILPIQHCQVEGKDYIIIVDEGGKVLVVDRKGQPRLKIIERFATVQPITIVRGKTVSSTYLIGIDVSGNVIKTSLKNDKENIKFDTFEKVTQFCYLDVDSDKKSDFIFLDQNELKVFSANKALRYKYTFEGASFSLPFVYRLPKGETVLGITSLESNEIFLFDKYGEVLKGFPLAGSTAFDITPFSDGNYGVVSASAKSVYMYKLNQN